MKTISVIIPLFNKEQTLGRALKSVFDQTMQPIEIIIVNDGSTDNGPNLVSNLTNKTVKLINQNNRGVSAARNTGTEISTGELIAFLDADDEWEPNYLLTIARLLKIYPDCIGAATSYFLGGPSAERSPICLKRLPFETKEGILTNYFEVSVHSNPPVWTSAVCIKKEALIKIGGFPAGVKAGEDLLTWARLAALGDFAYSTKPLATFWQENAHTYQSIPTRIPDRPDFVGEQLNKLYLSYHNPQRRYLRRYIGLWHKMRASVYLRSGMNRFAFKEIWYTLKNRFYPPAIFVYILLLIIPLKFRNAVFRHFSN